MSTQSSQQPTPDISFKKETIEIEVTPNEGPVEAQPTLIVEPTLTARQLDEIELEKTNKTEEQEEVVEDVVMEEEKPDEESDPELIYLNNIMLLPSECITRVFGYLDQSAHHALMKTSDEMFHFLLEFKVMELPSLHILAKAEHHLIAKRAIEFGADVEAKDKKKC